MRKAQEGPKTRKEMHTPQEFSRLKHNQQMKLEDQARQYRASVIQHQKVRRPHALNILHHRLTCKKGCPGRQVQSANWPTS